jgi:hypothetical protein
MNAAPVSQAARRRYAGDIVNGPVPVEILHTQGCGNWEAARDAVYRVAEKVGVVVSVRDVVVDTQEAAEALRFAGSPTVRVRGLDVQPEAEEGTDYGLG